MKNSYFEFVKAAQKGPIKNRPSPTFDADKKRQELEKACTDTINLTLGELDIPIPDAAFEQWRAEAEKRAAAGEEVYRLAKRVRGKYPPGPGTLELRRTAAQRFATEAGVRVNANDVVVATGGKGVLNAIGSTFGPEETVIMTSPGWPTDYDLMRDGTNIVVVDTKGRGLMTPQQLEQTLHDHPNVQGFLINTPVNPTGERYSAEEREQIMGIVNKHRAWQKTQKNMKPLTVIIDDPYGALNYDNTPLAFGAEEKQLFSDGGLAVVNSVSKVFASPDLRTGWLVTKNEAMLEDVRNYNSNAGPVATIEQQNEAQLALLFGDKFIEETKARLAKRADKVAELVKDTPNLSMKKPKGAIYAWIDTHKLQHMEVAASVTLNKKPISIEKPADVAEFLRQVAHVATVDGSPFYPPGSDMGDKKGWYVRMVLADENKLEQAFARISEAMKSKNLHMSTGWTKELQQRGARSGGTGLPGH